MKRTITAMLIVAVLLIFTGCGKTPEPVGSVQPQLPSPSPSAAPLPEPTPEPSPAISVSIETQNGIRTVNGFDAATFSYDYPRIIAHGEDSADYDALRQWAADMAADSQEITQNLSQEAESAYLGNAQWFTSSYYYTRTLEKNMVSPSITILLEDTTMYMGGNHPSHGRRAWVVDTMRGKLLTLSDLGDNEAIVNTAADSISKQINNSNLESELYPEYADSIKDGITDSSWYLSDNGLVVIYPEYTIAPYATGHLEFTVPYSELDKLIKPEYIIE